MIVGFGMKGFKSYKKYVDIDFYSNTETTEFNNSLISDSKILPFNVIYGANGSGKSNFLNGLILFKDILLGYKGFDFTNEDKYLEFQIRLVLDNSDFILNVGYCNEKRKFTNEHFAQIVDGQIITLFKIQDSKLINVLKDLGEDVKSAINVYFTDENNLLVITSIFKSKIFKNTVFNEFSSYLSNNIIDSSFKGQLQPRYSIENENMKSKLIDSLSVFDFDIEGINEIEISPMNIKDNIPENILKIIEADLKNLNAKDGLLATDNQYIIVKLIDGQIKFYEHLFKIKYVSKVLKFKDLSDGTKVMINLMYKMIANNNSLIIIDEIERSFHELLLKQLMKILRKNSITNNNQFLITTHSTSIMSLKYLRSDEINLCSKINAISSIENFNSYEKVERDISNLYLEGRYGSIPKIFDEISGESFEYN